MDFKVLSVMALTCLISAFESLSGVSVWGLAFGSGFGLDVLEFCFP
jgi:hypothetical protein